jgi:hypothetical protein
MLAMDHVVLHLGLCSAVLKRPPQTDVAVQVSLYDRINAKRLDKTFHLLRDYEPTGTISLDMPQGQYFMKIIAPQYGCSADDFIYLLPDRERTINEQLADGMAPIPQPVLAEGDAPAAFLYLQPTFVAFDKTSVDCNKPVPDPIPLHTVVENDQDSFYVWIYPDASLYQRGPLTLAMQLQTATGEEHYIRLKIPFPLPWGGWPSNLQMSITESDADGIATDPTGVLLCPKIYMTSVG